MTNACSTMSLLGLLLCAGGSLIASEQAQILTIGPAMRTTGPTLTHRLASGETYRYARLKTGQMEYVMATLYHPADDHLMYLRTDMNGAYRRDAASPDRWLWLLDSLRPDDGYRFRDFNEPTGLAVDPKDPNVVYYAASDGEKGGLYRSSDRGETWSKIFPRDGQVFIKNRASDKMRGESIAIDPRDGRTMFLGTQHNGLFSTTDGGTTWKQVVTGTGKDGSEMLSVVVAGIEPLAGAQRSRHIFAVRWNEGILHSADGGVTFTLIPDSPTQAGRLAVSGAGHLYAASKGKGLWRWTIATGGPGAVIDADAGNGVVASPGTDGAVIAFGQDLIKRSRDHGATWQRVSVADGNLTITKRPVHKADYFDNLNGASLHRDGKRFMIGNPFKVHETRDIWADTVIFDAIPDGADAKAMNCLTCPPASPSGKAAPLYLTIADHTAYRMESPETPVASSMNYMSFPNSIDYCEADPAILWVSNFAGTPREKGAGKTTISRTTTGGGGAYPGTFAKVGNPFDAGSAESVRVAVRSTPGGDHALAVTFTKRPTRMRYTTDGGKTWQSPTKEPDVRTGPTVWPANNPICADRVNGDYYAYGAWDGQFHRSSDGGATWERMSSGLPQLPDVWMKPESTWYDLQSIAGRAGGVLLALRTQVRTSVDGGRTWRVVESFEQVRNGCTGPSAAGDGTTLYVFGKRPGDRWGIYRCQNWFTAGAAPAWERLTPDLDVGGTEGGRKMAADRQVPGRVYMDNAETIYIEPVR